jgi:hypothetical protein
MESGGVCWTSFRSATRWRTALGSGSHTSKRSMRAHATRRLSCRTGRSAPAAVALGRCWAEFQVEVDVLAETNFSFSFIIPLFFFILNLYFSNFEFEIFELQVSPFILRTIKETPHANAK